MVSVHGEFWDETDTIELQANFRVVYKCVQGGKLYAISDGGADSCILGSSAHDEYDQFDKTRCRTSGI
jgi:hypothetical protein